MCCLLVTWLGRAGDEESGFANAIYALPMIIFMITDHASSTLWQSTLPQDRSI